MSDVYFGNSMGDVYFVNRMDDIYFGNLSLLMFRVGSYHSFIALASKLNGK